ncbi:hypothetical protein PRZ48_002745 [Zasmidium cellare]|uniref:HMG box domain-containing protein n=1 Tax=Zasmidium cellare TaxID=395010 RepID=A0ABR0EUE6_ZASCE|nr:hypothetical protein PRZ48_002745 [Zasmidium cellare]
MDPNPNDIGMDPKDIERLKDFTLTSDSDAGYTTSETTGFNPYEQFDASGFEPAEALFEPTPDVPAQNYHPVFGWWNPAGPYAPGAHYSLALGWHFPIAPARYPTGPASAVGAGVPSGYSTPQGPALPASGPQQTFMPQAPPMIPQGTRHAPSIGVPQPPTEGSGGYPQPPPSNPTAQRTQPSRSSTPRPQAGPSNPTRAPSTRAGRRGIGPNNKKLSLDRACVCKPRQKKVPRPVNAFLLYRKQTRMQIQRDIGTTHNDAISKECSARWAALGKPGQAPYFEQAKKIKQQHELENPGYHYTPNQRAMQDFGDETCTCGAYKANIKYRAKRDAMARNSPTADSPDSFDQALNDELFGGNDSDTTPTVPSRRKSTKGKRKRATSAMDIDTPTPKRQTRSAAKGKSYAEASDTETEAITVARPASRKTSSRSKAPAPIHTTSGPSYTTPASMYTASGPAYTYPNPNLGTVYVSPGPGFTKPAANYTMPTTDPFMGQPQTTAPIFGDQDTSFDFNFAAGNPMTLEDVGEFNFADFMDYPDPEPGSRRTSSRKSSGKKNSTGSKGSPTRRSPRLQSR